MINKAILIGHLGKDPELRYSNMGAPICLFSVATTKKWKDKDGNKQEKTTWHNVKAFGNLAEIAGQYLHKGNKVYLEGELAVDQWTDDNNNKRYDHYINLQKFENLSPKPPGQFQDVLSQEEKQALTEDEPPF